MQCVDIRVPRVIGGSSLGGATSLLSLPKCHRLHLYIQSLGIEHAGRYHEKKNVCVCVYICVYTCVAGSLC